MYDLFIMGEENFSDDSYPLIVQKIFTSDEFTNFENVKKCISEQFSDVDDNTVKIIIDKGRRIE